MKALVVDSVRSMGKSLGLHQIDKSLQVRFRGGEIRLCHAVFVAHPPYPIGDPGLQKELTGRIYLERVGRFKNGYPKLFTQSRGRHNQLPFFRNDQAPTGSRRLSTAVERNITFRLERRQAFSVLV
jgi:hypothetical protein